MRLEKQSAGLEKLEFDELAKSKTATTAVLKAKRRKAFPRNTRASNSNDSRPGFTVLLFLLQAGGAYLLCGAFPSSTTSSDSDSRPSRLSLFGTVSRWFCFCWAKFATTIARLEHHRLLRPGSSWALCERLSLFFAALGTRGRRKPAWSGPTLSRAHSVRAAGTDRGREHSSISSSKIYGRASKGGGSAPLRKPSVGLAGPAGRADHHRGPSAGLPVRVQGFRNVCFIASRKSAGRTAAGCNAPCCFYPPAWCSSEPGEQGLLERSADRSRAVRCGPGGAISNGRGPWTKVYRYRTGQVQSFGRRLHARPGHRNQNTVLWTVATANEEDFWSPPGAGSLATTNEATGRRTPPVSLLTVSFRCSSRSAICSPGPTTTMTRATCCRTSPRARSSATSSARI